jgi:hypothetical protein
MIEGILYALSGFVAIAIIIGSVNVLNRIGVALWQWIISPLLFGLLTGLDATVRRTQRNLNRAHRKKRGLNIQARAA